MSAIDTTRATLRRETERCREARLRRERELMRADPPPARPSLVRAWRDRQWAALTATPEYAAYLAAVEREEAGS
jgi:transposase InsO family protein